MGYFCGVSLRAARPMLALRRLLHHPCFGHISGLPKVPGQFIEFTPISLFGPILGRMQLRDIA
jgi:hypothetical protein